MSQKYDLFSENSTFLQKNIRKTIYLTTYKHKYFNDLQIKVVR